jgi:hypothetical protein
MAVRVTVVGQYDGRSIAAAQRDVDRLRKAYLAQAGPLTRLGNTIRSNLVPALGLAAAAAGALAVKFAVDGVKAAIADQKTVEVLAQTLENLGEAHKRAGVEEFIAAMESATGIADEELRPALGQLAIATGDVDEAQRRLQQAMDISVGTGQNLTTVVRAFQRALATGTAGTLSRYGVIIDENITKTQGFEAALDQAAGKFRGMAEREAKTLEGRLRILGVEFDNLKEAFGYGFINGLGETGDGMDSMADAIRDLKPAFEALGEQIGGAIGSLSTLTSNLQEMRNDGAIPANDVTKTLAENLLGFRFALNWAAWATSNLRSIQKATWSETERLAEAHAEYRDALVRTSSATSEVLELTEEEKEEMARLAEEAEKAAEAFDKLSGAIKRTNAVTGYQSAVDDLRKTLKETGGEASVFNDKGRETVDAYVDLAERAGTYIEGLDSQAQRAQAATDTLGILEQQLGNTKMDPATQAALLGPFQALIDDLYEAGLDVTGLQTQLDKIKSKTITVTVNTDIKGGRPPGVSSDEWYGNTAVGGMVGSYGIRRGISRGMDTVPTLLAPGEFVIRRQSVKQFGAAFFSQLNRGISPTDAFGAPGPSGGSSGAGGGLSIGTLNVTSAPGEKAEETVPRALRRLAFVAGL